MKPCVSGIASLTCDRVDLFTRSLASIADELIKSNRNILIAVSDDSLQVNTRNEKRRITSEIRDLHDIDTVYMGLEEKTAFLDILRESLPAGFNDSLNFMFSGNRDLTYIKGSGANRNAVLAAFADKRFISIDDDVEIKPRMIPGASADITFVSGDPDPDVFFSHDIKMIESVIEPFPGDPFRFYDSFTGADLPGLVPGAGSGKVAASMAGYYGGRWFQRPYTFFLPDGRLRDITFGSKENYKKTKYRMLGCIQAANVVISGSPLFIGGAIGIDASTIVPPFEPVVRCSDNLWAELLQYYNKEYMIASLPFALYHDWTEKLSFTEKDFKKIGADLGINMTLLFSAVAQKTSCPEGADPFVCFGKALVELSEMPHSKWMDMCRSIWYGYVGSMTETLNGLLVKYDRQPKYWAKDVDKFLDRIRSQSMDVASFVPRELHAAGSPEEAGRVHRKMLYDYGMLLVNWSRIWDEICKLNESGRGLLGDMYNTLR